MLLQVLLAVVVIILCYCALKYTQHLLSLNKYPTGPFPLPMIGNVHLLVFSNENPFVVFAQLSKKYGDVFSFSLGMERIVFVNSIHLAKEALLRKGTDFQGRPTNRWEFSLLSRNFKGIESADYTPEYIFNRKLGHKALKLMGDGVGTLEEKITMESEAMVEMLKKASGGPVDVGVAMENTVLNVIISVLFGSRYEHSDPDFTAVSTFNKRLTSFELRPDIGGVLPWTRLFYETQNIRRLKEGIAIRDAYIGKQLKHHQETYNPNTVRDFCDSLIKSVREEQHHWNEIGSHDDIKDSLEMILSGVVIAGTETVASSMTWAILYLLHWPHLQEELYEEITHVLGGEANPTLEHRSDLPLCQAFLQEVLRMASSLHLIPHKAIKTSDIGGKAVPKDALVMINVWAIHHDTREWEDPESFDPRRWLDSQGRCCTGHDKSYLPFGAGRRVCLGEQMAKYELFLFFTRMVKTFRIEPNAEEGFPGVREGHVGTVFGAKPFNAKFILR